MQGLRTIMTSKTLDAEQLLARMCDSTQQLIATRGLENPYIIGIHSGGVWLAERLHQHLRPQRLQAADVLR